MQHEDTAVTAAFVMEGMHDADYDRAIAAWDQGALEMVEQIMQCVPILLELRDAADAALLGNDCYPGVFDYEVSNPMGNWLARQIIEHKAMPERADMVRHAAQLVREFIVRPDTVNGEGIAEAVTVAEARLLEG
jgi:hypothetical protein